MPRPGTPIAMLGLGLRPQLQRARDRMDDASRRGRMPLRVLSGVRRTRIRLTAS